MTRPLKILVDETSDGLDIKLQNAGYDAESVKKLRLKDEKFGNDYNIMKYVEENDLIFITKDNEPARACRANGIRCICPNDDLILEKVILPELENMKND